MGKGSLVSWLDPLMTLAAVRASNSLREAVRKALDFVRAETDASGGWSDFSTNRSGQSTSWVTAYVLWQVGNLLPAREVSRGVAALLAERQPNGWGFSVLTPPDCDSTLHALRALQILSIEVPDSAQALDFVLSHQTEGGGFATYANANALRNYREEGDGVAYAGWLQPHVCVTTVALETLRTTSPPLSEPFTRASAYLARSQSPEGYWEAYWWRSRTLATARLVQQAPSGPTSSALTSALRAGNAWLERTQHATGFWDNGYDEGVPCLLSTATALAAITATVGTSASALTAADWLLRQQNHDGSWTSAPVLRIPPPDILSPETWTGWRTGSRGVGSRCSDDRRVYTTATVAATLHAMLLGLAQ